MSASDSQNLLQAFQTIATYPEDSTEFVEATRKISSFLEKSDGPLLLASKEMRPFLQAGLAHENDEVKSFTLEQILQALRSPQTLVIYNDPQASILPSLIQLLTTESTRVAEKISKVLVELCKYKEGTQVLFDNIQQLKNLLQHSAIVKMRVLDTMSSIGSLSLEHFEKCKSNGFYDVIATLVSSQSDNMDVLELLNSIELLDKVTLSHEGTAFLESKNVLESLSGLVKTRDDTNPFLGMLLPRIILFWGTLSKRGPLEASLLEKYALLPELKRHMLESTPEIKDASIGAVGDIGSTGAGFDLLLKNQQEGIPEEFINFLRSENALRLSCLHALANLIEGNAGNPTQEHNTVIKNLINNIPVRNGKTNIVNYTMELLNKNPILELRQAAFHVVKAVCSHLWGIQMFYCYPGFHQFITNRNSEESKEGKEWKYGIIQTIYKVIEHLSPQECEVSTTDKVDLHRYLKEGVWFVKKEAAVAIDTKAV